MLSASTIGLSLFHDESCLMRLSPKQNQPSDQQQQMLKSFRNTKSKVIGKNLLVFQNGITMCLAIISFSRDPVTYYIVIPYIFISYHLCKKS